MSRKHNKSYGRLSLFFLMLMAFLMPLSLRSIPVLIALFSMSIIAEGIVNKTFRFTHKPIVIIGVLFYLMHVVSLFYSEDKSAAWFDIGVKFSLLLFPLVFLFKSPKVIGAKFWVLAAFVNGSVLSSIIMLKRAYHNYPSNPHAFYYTDLGLFHPSYMAMYFVFAISILLKFLEDTNLKKGYQRLFYTFIGLLLVLIFLLQSKAGMISILAISSFLLIMALIQSRKALLKASIFTLLLSLALFFVQKDNRLHAMVQSVEEIEQQGQSDDTTTGMRYSIWKLCLSEIEQHWVFGVGSGDIKATLNKRYEEVHLQKALEYHLNAHNQYLETFLGQGIIGLSLLLLLLLLGLWEAWKRKSIYLAAFIFLIAFNMLPESMLNNQLGVVFIAFFYYFLFVFTDEDDEEGYFK
jgi:O-antigen ligase